MKDGERSVGGPRFILHVLSGAESSNGTPQMGMPLHRTGPLQQGWRLTAQINPHPPTHHLPSWSADLRRGSPSGACPEAKQVRSSVNAFDVPSSHLPPNFFPFQNLLANFKGLLASCLNPVH